MENLKWISTIKWIFDMKLLEREQFVCGTDHFYCCCCCFQSHCRNNETLNEIEQLISISVNLNRALLFPLKHCTALARRAALLSFVSCKLFWAWASSMDTDFVQFNVQILFRPLKAGENLSIQRTSDAIARTCMQIGTQC